jgi:hypothetical protein
MCLNIPHPTVPYLLWCKCGHTIDDLGIHLLRHLCENEHTTTHDTLWNTIATIALKSGAHIQRKVFHLFLRHTWRQVDIIITKDNFWTLANIVIGNPTRTDLAQWISTMTTYAMMMAAQDKARSYTKQVPRNDFIPLAIETYSCLHLCFDSFLFSCVHACIAHNQ